jgi:hypothetical protein
VNDNIFALWLMYCPDEMFERLFMPHTFDALIMICSAAQVRLQKKMKKHNIVDRVKEIRSVR